MLRNCRPSQIKDLTTRSGHHTAQIWAYLKVVQRQLKDAIDSDRAERPVLFAVQYSCNIFYRQSLTQRAERLMTSRRQNLHCLLNTPKDLFVSPIYHILGLNPSEIVPSTIPKSRSASSTLLSPYSTSAHLCLWRTDPRLAGLFVTHHTATGRPTKRAKHRRPPRQPHASAAL